MSERTVTLNGVQVNETQLREALERIERGKREKREDRTKPFMGGNGGGWATYVNIPLKDVRRITGHLKDCDFLVLCGDGSIGFNYANSPYAGPFLGFKESK